MLPLDLGSTKTCVGSPIPMSGKRLRTTPNDNICTIGRYARSQPRRRCTMKHNATLAIETGTVLSPVRLRPTAKDETRSGSKHP